MSAATTAAMVAAIAATNAARRNDDDDDYDYSTSLTSADWEWIMAVVLVGAVVGGAILGYLYF